MLLNTSTAAQPLMFIHCHVTDIIRLFFPSMGFLRLVFLPVLLDSFLITTVFRTTFPHSWWVVQGDVRNFRSRINRVHLFRDTGWLVFFLLYILYSDKFNVMFLSHSYICLRNSSGFSNDYSNAFSFHQYLLSFPMINRRPTFMSSTIK